MPLATPVAFAANIQPERRTSPKSRLLKLGRQIHLYIGAFSAPALLFFAFSGALQTFSLHEAKRGSEYKPAHWLVVMGELHKNQTAETPPHKPQFSPEAVTPKPAVPVTSRPDSALSSKFASSPSNGRTHHPLPLKIFFVIVSVGFISSVLTGIYLSYRYHRNKLLVTAVLLAGLIVPMLLAVV